MPAAALAKADVVAARSTRGVICMRKNKVLATVLATIPGLGHFYLGLYKRGIAFIGLFLFSILIQGFIIYPLLILPVETVLSTDSFITQLFSTLFFAPFWFYGWQIRDAHLQTEQVNFPNSQKIVLTPKFNKR